MAGKVKYQTKLQRKQQDVPAYTTDVTKDVIAAVRAGGNSTFANWRDTLRQQGWANPELIKYDPTSGKFISSDPKLSPQAFTDAVAGDANADAAAVADDASAAAEAAASRVESMPDAGIPGRSFVVSDTTGAAHVPDIASESPSELAVGVAPLAKSSSSGVSSDVAKGFLLALRMLGFGSGAGNSEASSAGTSEPGLSDFIGNGGTYWDSSAPATGYRPEPKTSDYSVGPSRALRDEIHNAAIRTDQDISGQNWRASN